MMSDIKHELSKLETTHKTLRDFGLLLFAVLCLWAGLLMRRGSSQWPWPAGAAAGLLVAGLFFSGMLRRPYQIWMLLAFTLGWFMTRVVVTLAYVVVMTPMSLLLRALNKDVLDKRIERQASSYWKKHEHAADEDRYRRQF